MLRPPLPPLRPIAFAALAAPLFATLATFGASCVSLYDLDDYGSAIRELCAVVAECDPSFYPACVDQANARLDAATSEERRDFLLAFTDTGCLETCGAAKSCFDMLPLCVSSTSACSVRAQCCGFWKAGALCERSSCCQPNGVSCADDGDCCDGECLPFESGKTCGGVTCSQLDESCGGEVDCCGELRCSAVTQTCVQCDELGAPCESGADCCTDYCSNAATGEASGVCENPSCGLFRLQPCEDAEACCDDFCVSVPQDEISICNDQACIPNGFGCEVDAKCCSGSCVAGVCQSSSGCSLYFHDPCASPAECCEGTCDTVTSECCRLDGATCTSSFDCCGDSECLVAANGFTTCQGRVSCGEPDGKPCDADADCCSQKCEKTLSHCCVTLDDTCTHGVCNVDSLDPLSPDCSDVTDGSDPDDPTMSIKGLFGNPGCIASVCETPGFEYCCCDRWDEPCRDMAMQSDVCDVACPVDPF